MFPYVTYNYPTYWSLTVQDLTLAYIKVPNIWIVWNKAKIGSNKERICKNKETTSGTAKRSSKRDTTSVKGKLERNTT